MNKKLLFTLLLGIVYNAFTQAPTDYRRSSLSFILLENPSLGQSRDLVVNAYMENPFPDQFNQHKIDDSRFEVEKIQLSTQDYLNAGWYVDTLRTAGDFLKALKKPLNPLRYLNAEQTVAIQEPTESQILQIKLQKFIYEKQIAKQMVATWLNRDPESGKMNFSTLIERGKYSASAEKMDELKTVADESIFLKDFDLIGNTYVCFNKMDFYPNEPVARMIRDAAKETAIKELTGKPQILLDKALALADTIYEKTKVGYTVSCNSFLYSLVWNDSISNKVKSYFFNENINPKTAWDTTTLFRLTYVGNTVSSSIVTFKIGETRSEEQIINLQVRRTVDNSVAKLQKEYVQFRAVAPVSSIGPLTARIGLKEGLQPKDKFEILEMGMNELGLPMWNSIGTVSVDGSLPIWDNRQGAEVEITDPNSSKVSFTTFSGGKKAQVGLHYLRAL
jgi:hypothetical protein